MGPLQAKLRAITVAAKPVRPEGASLVAAPNVRPEAWQALAKSPVHEILNRSRPTVGPSAELERILALPRRPPVDLVEGPTSAELVARVTKKYSNGAKTCDCATALQRPCLKELKPVQAWALEEAEAVGGLLGLLGTGAGKTVLDILLPMAFKKCKLAVLLIPPGLKQQTIDEYEAIRRHFNVPSLICDGFSSIIPGRPVLHVLAYSKLSRPESTTLLEQYQPDLIIADEAHRLRHVDTASTGRFLRYVAHRPTMRFVPLSGTLTNKSLKDYGHHSAIALKDNSPLPIDPDVLETWALAIDASDWPAPMGSLVALCKPGEHVRDGFRRRLNETPGVVATKASAIDASIYITERPAPKIPQEIQDHLKHLRTAWERPDGEELVEALQVAKCARELACGFYYRWKYPRGEARELIDRWFKCRRAWHQELREKLKFRQEHMDSPLLCAKAAIRAYQVPAYDGPLPIWRSNTWEAWRDVRDEVQPVSEAVWVDDYLAADAAQWGQKHLGLIWYEFDAFGRRVADLAGLPLHGGGPGAEERILAERGERSLVVSIKSHGTGRNGLQWYFNNQLVANPPASGDTIEQLLARTHRIGQKEDEIHAAFYRHTPEMREAIDKAVLHAKYIQATMGNAQKLLFANVAFPLKR